jgi:hypothetical protein
VLQNVTPIELFYDPPINAIVSPPEEIENVPKKAIAAVKSKRKVEK